MIRPAKVRAIRAFLGDTQAEFAKRLKTTRYVVIHWERFGIVDQADLERRIRDLEGPRHDRREDTGQRAVE